VYLNSYFQAGIKSPLDDAILKHDHPAILEYQKVDEIPSTSTASASPCGAAVATTPPRYQGEAESVLAICGTVIVDGPPNRSTKAGELRRRRPLRS